MTEAPKEIIQQALDQIQEADTAGATPKMVVAGVPATVLQQALNALEHFCGTELTWGQRFTNEGQGLLDTINALRAALAYPTPPTEPAPAKDAP